MAQGQDLPEARPVGIVAELFYLRVGHVEFASGELNRRLLDALGHFEVVEAEKVDGVDFPAMGQMAEEMCLYIVGYGNFAYVVGI